MTVQLAKNTTVKVGGASTSMVDEATTDAGDHKTYQVTNAAKRAIDPGVAITVKSDGSPLAADLYAMNYADGKITFFVARGGAEVITLTANYRPLLAVGEAHAAGITIGAEHAAVGRFTDAAGRKTPALAVLAGELSAWHPFTEDLDPGGATLTLLDLLAAEAVFLEIKPGGTEAVRGWVSLDVAKWEGRQGPEAAAVSLPFRGVVRTCVGRPATDQALWSWT